MLLFSQAKLLQHFFYNFWEQTLLEWNNSLVIGNFKCYSLIFKTRDSQSNKWKLKWFDVLYMFDIIASGESLLDLV